MNTKIKVAFICYLLVALVSVVGGLYYFFAPELMPYHQEVIGMDWEEVDPQFQLMFLALLHGGGLGMFTQGLALIILLTIPFRKGEAWTRWAIPAIILPNNIFLLYTTLYLKLTMQASTPWQLFIITLLLTFIAITLSYVRSKEQRVLKGVKR